MKKIVAILSVLMFSTGVLAQENVFFSRSIPGWDIRGHHTNKELHASCLMEKGWNDGSVFTLIKDLEDGELYILMNNNGWNIADTPGNYRLRINFFYSNGQVAGGNMVYELLNKNTMRIRGIYVDPFLKGFTEATRLQMIMPGSIPNIVISLQGSNTGIEIMSECIRSFKTRKNNTGKGLDL